MSDNFETANRGDDHTDRPMNERVFYLMAPDEMPVEALRRNQAERQRRQWMAIKSEFERLAVDFETLRHHCANPARPIR
jgi:hypothetical protein